VTDTPDEKSTAIEEAELAEASTETDVAKDEATEADTEATEADEATPDEQPVVAAQPDRKGIEWAKVAAFGVIPALALILALAAGWLKFVDNSASDDVNARIESIQVAKDSTVALLSYQPDKVQQQLTDAEALLTGGFKDDYKKLITDVVIPGAQQKQISAVATVPRAASVSADQKKAVVLVLVNQNVIVGADAPTATASSVRVELQKVDGKWLISKFEPV
jgi:Mce-associated membrane protein